MNSFNCKMDQELAKRLLKEGAFFILVDFPVGSSIGIDMNEYVVSEKFRGFKMIPKGLHFITYNCASYKDINQKAPKSGFFYYFKEKEVVIKKWNVFNEEIDTNSVSEQVFQRYEDNRFCSLDSFLAPYPFDEYQRWKSLTDYITLDLMNKLSPNCGTIRSVPQLIPLKFCHGFKEINKSISNQSTHNLDDLLPKMEVEPNSMIHYTPIPKIKYPSGSNATEMTKHSIDHTFLLKSMFFQNNNSYDFFLGEFQFSFVTFLIGQVYESFEHWKSLIKIICRSDEALEMYPQMFINFIRVFHFQLKEVPCDLFVDIVEKDNFLTANLREFFLNLRSNQNLDHKLLERAYKFKQNITKKFKWDFDAEPEDECPVIVKLD